MIVGHLFSYLIHNELWLYAWCIVSNYLIDDILFVWFVFVCSVWFQTQRSYIWTNTYSRMNLFFFSIRLFCYIHGIFIMKPSETNSPRWAMYFSSLNSVVRKWLLTRSIFYTLAEDSSINWLYTISTHCSKVFFFNELNLKKQKNTIWKSQFEYHDSKVLECKRCVRDIHFTKFQRKHVLNVRGKYIN